VHASGGWRRAGPAALVGAALLFGALSVVDAWVVARHFREDADATSRLFGRVFAGLNDPRPDAATEALFDLAAQVHRLGLPVAITDTAGRITALDNAPANVAAPGADPARVRAWIAELDAANVPIVQPGLGTVHFGAIPEARRLTILGLLQAAVLLCLIGLAWWAGRERVAGARDRLWAAMARESAHQLGTPLMSLTGWLAQLREHPQAVNGEMLEHLEADAERLHRVARRFERIGRPARREPVGLGSAAERVVRYFEPRLPTLDRPVTLSLVAGGPGPMVLGDAVLLEWAIEALVKNAIDALSGRGGRVEVRVTTDGAHARLGVSDDGPGVAPLVRSRLFEPGTSTKPGGWGIGLALVRRIVEQQHGGRVAYHAATPGSAFTVDIPLAPPA